MVSVIRLSGSAIVILQNLSQGPSPPLKHNEVCCTSQNLPGALSVSNFRSRDPKQLTAPPITIFPQHNELDDLDEQTFVRFCEYVYKGNYTSAHVAWANDWGWKKRLNCKCLAPVGSKIGIIASDVE